MYLIDTNMKLASAAPKPGSGCGRLTQIMSI